VNPAALTAGLMKDWMTGADYKPIDAYNELRKELEV
jgi:hypothetical protein